MEHFSVFLQKWRAKVEVSFLRRCVDPNAPKEPLDADAQAEADGGDDEAPPDVERAAQGAPDPQNPSKIR